MHYHDNIIPINKNQSIVLSISHKINYLEDPDNQDCRYERVYLDLNSAVQIKDLSRFLKLLSKTIGKRVFLLRLLKLLENVI